MCQIDPEATIHDSILQVLDTLSYKDDWGYGLTSLEIANHLTLQRDIVTPQMTKLGRSGVTEYIQCKRNGSDCRLWWITGKSPVPILIDKKSSLKDRAKALCKYIRIITNKHSVDDPMQDLADIESKTRELMPEFY